MRISPQGPAGWGRAGLRVVGLLSALGGAGVAAGRYLTGASGHSARVRRATGIFRAAVAFPSEAIAAPAFINGVDFSDHWSFAQAGFAQAIMITDTAFFRNAHYHRLTDTSDRLDYDRMSRVIAGRGGGSRGSRLSRPRWTWEAR